jgi:hypothetical protein
LIGEDTANRPWVQYEIKQAWKKGMPILGVYIHNLKCPRGKTSRKGKNPFELFSLNDGRKISELIDCYEPTSYSAYRDIAANLEQWVNQAVLRRKQNVF